MDLVDEVHVVNARLHLEHSSLDPKASLDVVRGLGFQREVSGYGIEEGIESGTRGDPFVDIRGAERAGGAAEYRKNLVESMFETKMQRILRFVAVKRVGLGVEGSGRSRVETISGTQSGVLGPRAIREICGRQQSNRLLPVAGKRLLIEIVDMDWRQAVKLAAIRVVGRVVIVDPGQNS